MNKDNIKSSYCTESFVNPRRDWKFLLIFFLLIVFVSFSYGLYKYLDVSNNSMYVDLLESEIKIERLNVKKMQELIRGENVKENRFENQGLSIIDPSL